MRGMRRRYADALLAREEADDAGAVAEYQAADECITRLGDEAARVFGVARIDADDLLAGDVELDEVAR